jgi:hypothetical protein
MGEKTVGILDHGYGKSAPFENHFKRQELFIILVSSDLHLKTGDGKDWVARP